MDVRTYGKLFYKPTEVTESTTRFLNKPKKVIREWVMDELPPHVCMKLKAIFPKIGATTTAPFYFQHTPDVCFDLLWFMERWSLQVSPEDMERLQNGKGIWHQTVTRNEDILRPDYVPRTVTLNPGCEPRIYQLVAKDYWMSNTRFLLGDDMGLGKTISAIISLKEDGMLPAAIVMQAHLPRQWQREIEKWTGLTVHCIKKNSSYSLPAADVYLFKYTSISGWVDYFSQGPFMSAIFDEVQELRHDGTAKYGGALALSENVQRVMAMSGTPIYNYGNEIFNVMNIVKPGCMGTKEDFLREWCGSVYGKIVKEPSALGAFMRDNHLMLRRTRQDVGRELPPVNKIVWELDEFDESELDNFEEIGKRLALSTLNGSFTERGPAAREFDLRMRQVTGLAKASAVAAYVKMLLEGGVKNVLLAGWHRDVYTTWNDLLAEYKPVMYTGSETAKQKDESVEKFVSGESRVFIISLRSGIGLDGLQYATEWVVFGEFDWSPKVHEQVRTRVDRDGYSGDGVTEVYPFINYGSDPTIMDMLGLKASQSQGIMDPFSGVGEQYSDESRVKKLAENYLKSLNVPSNT